MPKDFNVIHEECFYDSDTQKLTITLENSGDEAMGSASPEDEHNIFPVSPDDSPGAINFEQNGIIYDFYKSGNYFSANDITIDADYSTVTSKTSDNTYGINSYPWAIGISPPLDGNDKITFVLQLSGINSNTTYVFGADYQMNYDSEEIEHNATPSNNYFAFGYGIPNASVTSPITNSICFAKGTIISTDQGNVEIQNIVPGKHTIGEKAICHITKTISPEKKIVCVKKNAFGKNKPNKAITMSGNHCIQCEKGAMVKAKELVANNRNMKFVEYNQEPHYNVLMEDHNVIKVQNLEVETLDPENIVAKIYNSVMDKSTLAKLVKQMNEGIRENNREKYICAEHKIRNTH